PARRRSHDRRLASREGFGGGVPSRRRQLFYSINPGYARNRPTIAATGLGIHSRRPEIPRTWDAPRRSWGASRRWSPGPSVRGSCRKRRETRHRARKQTPPGRFGEASLTAQRREVLAAGDDLG